MFEITSYDTGTQYTLIFEKYNRECLQGVEKRAKKIGG